MESKKRPLVDGDDHASIKRRALAGKNGSPQSNSHDEIEDEDVITAGLELFRKEAIWRRMQEYKCDSERSHAKIQQLEFRKSTCEAGLAAMSACWAQLIETIRSLVEPDDLPHLNVCAKDILDLTAQIQSDPPEDLSAVLGDSVHATKALISTFAQLNHQSKTQHSSSDSNSASEGIQLRAEINLLRARLSDCQDERDRYRKSLQIAEHNYHRARSGTVRELEVRLRKAGSGIEPKEEKSQPASPMPVPSTPAHVNGEHDSAEIGVLKAQLHARDQKIAMLEQETAVLQDRVMLNELDAEAPIPERLRTSKWFQAMEENMRRTHEALKEKSEAYLKAVNELENLTTSKSAWEQGVLTSANAMLEETKGMILKRDNENSRLREQRDQLNAELNERKNKDSVRWHSIQEYQKLVDQQAERLRIYQSEIARYRTRLAAANGDETLLRFFLNVKRTPEQVNIDVDVLAALRNHLADLENRYSTLEQTLSTSTPDLAQCMKAQADALAELLTTQKELEYYKRTYGNSSQTPPNMASLNSQLQYQQSEIERLRLFEQQASESEKSLFLELEKLSTIWEEQDRQLKEKVFNLANLEEKYERLANEKGKSDNKYFAIMREKEASENERQRYVKTVEKQERAIAALENVVAQSKQAHANLQRDLTIARRRLESLEPSARESDTLRALLETTENRNQAQVIKVEERYAAMRALNKDFEDTITRLKKELENQTAAMAALEQAAREKSSGKHRAKGAVGDMQDLRHIAFCSTCAVRPRDTIITKCMHTFCRECVDIRVQTRQRKCPHCNLPFGQADVHNIFFN